MKEQPEMLTLEDLLDRMSEMAQCHNRIRIEAVLEAVGRRSFGPLLLIPGLIALSPLSGIPGVPTLVGVMVLLTTSQLLVGRSEFWLPQFVLRRSATCSRVQKAVAVLRPVARVVDSFLKPRLSFLVDGPAVYVIAAFCLLVSLFSPLLEVVPFAITGVGAAVSAFGLALISHDGVLAFLAFVFCMAIAVLAAPAVLAVPAVF